MCHLWSSEGVQSQTRIARFKLAEQILIELYTQLWVHTSLQKQLVSAKLKEASNLLVILLKGCDIVLLGLVRLAVEVTEQTTRCADICCIYITVYLPSDNIGVRHIVTAKSICRLSKSLKRCIVIQTAGLVICKRLAVKRFTDYIIYPQHTTTFYDPFLHLY